MPRVSAYYPALRSEKALQRALLQYYDKSNADSVREALIKAGRRDLIGFSEKCLVAPSAVKNHQQVNSKNYVRKNKVKR